MKRLYRFLVWSALLAVAALLLIEPLHDVEARRSAAIRARYDGFSGVLRLWIDEDLSCGGESLLPWLNGRIAAFEKKHSGVYIQTACVDEETLQHFSDGSVNPPDMLLISPGLLETTDALLALDESSTLRPALRHAGLFEGTRYAMPVALGAYALVYNRTLLDALPSDWSTLDALPNQADWLNWPADTPRSCWSAALIALFSGLSAPEAVQEGPRAGEGLNLGLPTPESSPTPTPQPAELIENHLPSYLPDSFRRLSSVYSEFAGGDLAAIPARPTDIRRLEQLSLSGKAPDWTAAAPGVLFSDQMALLAVTNCERADLPQRQTLCREFTFFLLSEESQTALARVYALPVIQMEPIYDAASAFYLLQQRLAEDELLTAPCFENDWRLKAAVLADQVTAGELTPRQALDALRPLME